MAMDKKQHLTRYLEQGNERIKMLFRKNRPCFFASVGAHG